MKPSKSHANRPGSIQNRAIGGPRSASHSRQAPDHQINGQRPDGGVVFLTPPEQSSNLVIGNKKDNQDKYRTR